MWLIYLFIKWWRCLPPCLWVTSPPAVLHWTPSRCQMTFDLCFHEHHRYTQLAFESEESANNLNLFITLWHLCAKLRSTCKVRKTFRLSSCWRSHEAQPSPLPSSLFLRVTCCSQHLTTPFHHHSLLRTSLQTVGQKAFLDWSPHVLDFGAALFVFSLFFSTSYPRQEAADCISTVPL